MNGADSGSISGMMGQRGIKPTPNRILVLRAMLAAARPVSLPELEAILETMDKSSIFRVLGIFVRHHLVHAIEDGSGMSKYEVCHGERECTLDDMHTHFYCESCHRIFCFPSIHVPAITLPEGFVMTSVNYMVKGICAHCASKPRK